MPTPPLFKFYLMADASTYYYVSGSTVLTTTTKTPINDVPSNWNDTELKWARDTTYFGVFRSVSTQFQFPFADDGSWGDGAFILKHIDAMQGQQGECILMIEKRIDTESYPGALDFWRYETLYQSEFDFSKIFIDEAGCNVQINTLDSRLYELLKAYGDTNYNIQFDYTDPDWKLLNMTGVDLYAEYRFIGPDFLTTNQNDPVKMDSSLNYAQNYLASIAYLQPTTQTANTNAPVFTTNTIGAAVCQNQFTPSSGGQQQGYDQNAQFEPWKVGGGPNNYIINCFSDQLGLTAHIKCNVSLGVIPGYSGYNPDVYFNVAINGYDGTSVNPVQVISCSQSKLVLSGHAEIGPFQVDWDFVNANFYAGRVYALVFYFTQVGLPNNNYQIVSSPEAHAISLIELTLKGFVRYSDTTSQAYPPAVVFDKLVSLLSSVQGNFGYPEPAISNPYHGVSNYLTNTSLSKADNYDIIPANVLYTSGNALRMFDYKYEYITPVPYPSGQQYLSTTLSEFFKAMFAQYGVGMGIEGNNLRMEQLSYFFDKNTEIANIGPVAKFTRERFTHYAATTVDIGYPDETYNLGAPIYSSGMNEINLHSKFQLPLTRTPNSLDWQANYKAACFSVEYGRSNAVSISSSSGVSSVSSTQTDSTSDNSVFGITTDGTTTAVNFQPPGVMVDTVAVTPGPVVITLTSNAWPSGITLGQWVAVNNTQGTTLTIVSANYTGTNQYTFDINTGVNAGDSITFAYKVAVNAQNIERYPTAHAYVNPGDENTPFYINGLGPYQDTMYNFGLTPKKCLLRKGGLLHAICAEQDSKNIIFNQFCKTSGIDPATNLYAGLVDEYADIPIGSLPAPLFLPVLFKFDCPLPVNMYSLITNNPRGYISFSWKGIQIKGFIWEVTQRPGDKGVTSLQLLAHPDTDLTQL